MAYLVGAIVGLLFGAVDQYLLEPLVRAVTGRLSPEPFVWAVEVALGAIFAVASISMIVNARRARYAVLSVPPT